MLSNHADLVSGGDALVEVVPAPLAHESIEVTVAGVDALASTPILDIRFVSNYELHTAVHTHVLRARLEKEAGEAANHVRWRAPLPLERTEVPEQSLVVMDRWLAAIEADDSSDPARVKVLRHKPDEAVHACWFAGQRVTDTELCDTLLPHYGLPRMVAGESLSHDVLKCRLVPIDWSDYAPVELTPDQRARLEAVFPDGVCDWTQPGVGQEPALGPWVSFASGPGGQPLGDPPVSQPE